MRPRGAGGTVGDIESMPFIEALRQLQYKIGKENMFMVQVKSNLVDLALLSRPQQNFGAIPAVRAPCRSRDPNTKTCRCGSKQNANECSLF